MSADIAINPLAAEFIYPATSAECAGQINRPTTVKWLGNIVSQQPGFQQVPGINGRKHQNSRESLYFVVTYI